MKFPIGIQSFECIITDGYVYVDKTDFVYTLAHSGKIYFLSRPRRFGKSLLVSTLGCYFEGRKDLFKGLAIEKLETEWKKYPVFRIDFSDIDYDEPDALARNILSYVRDCEDMYGVKADPDLSLGGRFAKVLAAAHRQTGLRCVVLVDEYDKPLLDVMGSELIVNCGGNTLKVEDRNRDVLKAFYSTFKKADDDLQFVFLTGVTKFAQVSVFSGLNQPKDISMDDQYDTVCGITEEEIDKYFSEPVGRMAVAECLSVDETRQMLRKRYDGYHFSRRLIGVYNPFSLLNALDQCLVDDYWFSSGTPTYLIRLLEDFNEDIDKLTSVYYDRSQFVDYRADKEVPLPMIFQSGYLTIKDYDKIDNTFLLGYPNDEVRRGFLVLVASNYLKTKEEPRTWVQNAMKSLRIGDLETFRTNMTSFLASVPYSVRRSSEEHEMERYFHFTLYLILRIASTYVIYTEKCQSQGRVDCVIETDKYIYIFEFKLDGSADEALKQIEDKGYANEYASDSRKLFKIGCSFSSKTGTIGEWKTKPIEK